MITNLQVRARIIRRGSRVPDEAGTGWIVGPDITTSERIRIAPAGTRALSIARSLNVEIDAVCSLRPGAAIERGDIIRVGEFDYSVVSVSTEGMPTGGPKLAMVKRVQALP